MLNVVTISGDSKNDAREIELLTRDKEREKERVLEYFDLITPSLEVDVDDYLYSGGYNSVTIPLLLLFSIFFDKFRFTSVNSG